MKLKTIKHNQPILPKTNNLDAHIKNTKKPLAVKQPSWKLEPSHTTNSKIAP